MGTLTILYAADRLIHARAIPNVDWAKQVRLAIKAEAVEASTASDNAISIDMSTCFAPTRSLPTTILPPNMSIPLTTPPSSMATITP